MSTPSHLTFTFGTPLGSWMLPCCLRRLAPSSFARGPPSLASSTTSTFLKARARVCRVRVQWYIEHILLEFALVHLLDANRASWEITSVEAWRSCVRTYSWRGLSHGWSTRIVVINFEVFTGHLLSSASAQHQRIAPSRVKLQKFRSRLVCHFLQ